MKRIALSAAVASLAMIGAAQAQTIAIATTPVNIRSGPGPENPIIGSIGTRRQAMVIGCIEGSLWCQVNFRGLQGWAYSQYMTLRPVTREVVVTTSTPFTPSMVPVVTYQAPTYYQAPSYRSAMAAAIDVDARGAFAMAPAAITPPPAVGTYVTTNPLASVSLDNAVVVGVGMPLTVQLQPVPDYRFQYVYVNGQPVLVDPVTRRIVYVFP